MYCRLRRCAWRRHCLRAPTTATTQSRHRWLPRSIGFVFLPRRGLINLRAWPARDTARQRSFPTISLYTDFSHIHRIRHKTQSSIRPPRCTVRPSEYYIQVAGQIFVKVHQWTCFCSSFVFAKLKLRSRSELPGPKQRI